MIPRAPGSVAGLNPFEPLDRAFTGETLVKKALAIGIAGSVSLLALAMAVPGEGIAQRGANTRVALPASSRPVGTFTPAVRDPRLAAELARRGEATAFQFTPATTQAERSRAVRVAVRVRPGVTMAQRARPSAPGMAAATTETPSGTPIAPSTYNLGVAVGWRRFAITGESSNSSGGAGGGSQESSKIAVDYRATPRLTARVQVAAEKADGVQRIVTDEQAVALDVGGSYSIARGIDVTGGVRYRVSRDRIEPLARDERRDSQAVYIGTAVRF
jgi:hypothetical protein